MKQPMKKAPEVAWTSLVEIENRDQSKQKEGRVMKLISLIILFFIQLPNNLSGQSIGTLFDWEYQPREEYSRVYNKSLIKLSEIRLSDYNFFDINHLEVDRNGNLMFFDYSEHQIIYLPDGNINKVVRIGKGEGRGPEEFGNPFDSKFDSDGNIWITDVERMNIQKWSATGQLIKAFNTDKYVRSIKIAVSDSGFLYVLSEQFGPKGVIHKYDMQGKRKGSFQTPKNRDFRSILYFEGDFHTLEEDLIFAGRVKPFLRKYSPDGKLLFSKGIIGFSDPEKVLIHEKKWTSRNKNLIRATIDVQIQLGTIYAGISNRIDRWIRVIDLYDNNGDYLSSLLLESPALKFAVYDIFIFVLEYNDENDEVYLSKYEIADDISEN